MTDSSTLTRARAGDQEAFRLLVEPYRRELQLRCYRILGSLQDAEHLLQDTLLAAWRGLDCFEGRASVRSWLYRIATNRCLNAKRDSKRRRFEQPVDVPALTRMTEPLEPCPDVLLDGIGDFSPGPDARYETKETVALVFITFLQHLPPQQRAVFVLRDVLGFPTSEVASMLDASDASVNSALQRARATLKSRTPSDVSALARAPLPGSADERELLAQFADAFEDGDTERIVALLTHEALLTMPPQPGVCRGKEAIATYLRHSGHFGGEDHDGSGMWTPAQQR